MVWQPPEPELPALEPRLPGWEAPAEAKAAPEQGWTPQLGWALQQSWTPGSNRRLGSQRASRHRQAERWRRRPVPRVKAKARPRGWTAGAAAHTRCCPR